MSEKRFVCQFVIFYRIPDKRIFIDSVFHSCLLDIEKHKPLFIPLNIHPNQQFFCCQGHSTKFDHSIFEFFIIGYQC